jgi:hypothetical protein
MQERLEQMGHGAKGKLAAFLGVRPDAVTRMANTDPNKETREIRGHELLRMQQFFHDDPFIQHEPEIEGIPIVGYVGAGAVAHFYGNSQGELERVPAPPDSTRDTVVVEVRGESLGPLFEHWLVYYDEVHSPVTQDMIGRLCVVGLPDDRVLVKRIKRARTEGLFHLESNTEPTMLDVEIAWAAKVKRMEPR